MTWLQLLRQPACLIAFGLSMAWLVGAHALDQMPVWKLWRYFSLIIAVILFVYRKQIDTHQHVQPIFTGLLVAGLCGGVIHTGAIAILNHIKMGEFDFFALYMDASAAWNRLDFYEPTVYQAMLQTLDPPFKDYSVGFSSNVLEVGTKYPPPTLLYLMPFGALSWQNAHIAWVLVEWLMMFLTIWLIWAKIFKDNSLIGFLIVTVIVLLMPGTYLTLILEQTHFTALVMLLLATTVANPWLKGMFTVFGATIKPPAGAIALVFLRQGAIKTIVAMALSTLALCLISLYLFGLNVFKRFFTDNPNLRVTETLYYEDMNRSLLGNVIRMFGWDFSQGSPMGHPIFILVAVTITIVTSIAFILARPNKSACLTALMILFALLIYPGTQKHYAVIVLAPIVLLWQHTRSSTYWAQRIRPPVVAMVVSAALLFGLHATWWVVFCLWCIALLFILVERKTNDPRQSRA